MNENFVFFFNARVKRCWPSVPIKFLAHRCSQSIGCIAITLLRQKVLILWARAYICYVRSCTYFPWSAGNALIFICSCLLCFLLSPPIHMADLFITSLLQQTCAWDLLCFRHSAIKRRKGTRVNSMSIPLEIKCLLWEIKLDIHTNNYVIGLMCAMEEYFVKNHKPIPFPLVCNSHT